MRTRLRIEIKAHKVGIKWQKCSKAEHVPVAFIWDKIADDGCDKT